MKIRNLAQLLIFTATIPILVHADTAQPPLIFTAPPRETPAAAKKLYSPLAKKLTQLVGRKVVYKYPGLYIGDWGTYSHQMQQGKYTFVFDGPQFVSWRMKYLHDIPLASLPGHLGYLIATDNPDVKSLKNLIGNRVCGIDSPNLLTISFLSKFSDPVQQPVLIAIDSGGMPAIHRAQLAGKCHTAIYRDSYFEHHLSTSERSKFRVIYRSPRNLPNQTLTAGPNISPAARHRIITALTNAKQAKAAVGVFKRFAKGATHFVAAKPSDFKGLYKLLTPLGSISGWVPGS